MRYAIRMRPLWLHHSLLKQFFPLLWKTNKQNHSPLPLKKNQIPHLHKKLFFPTISFILFPSCFETGKSTVWLNCSKSSFWFVRRCLNVKVFDFSLQEQKRGLQHLRETVKLNKKGRNTATRPQFLSKWLNFHSIFTKIAKQTSVLRDITIKYK